jgi:quercetin dioxygenase-like cupin family protein
LTIYEVIMPIIRKPQSATHELPHARFTSLATPRSGSRETSLWRVHLQPGGEPTLHQLTREELFWVLSGNARVQLGEQLLEAAAGDVIVVPAHTRFSLSAGGEEPLEALCCFPVGGQAMLEGGAPFTPPWAE